MKKSLTHLTLSTMFLATAGLGIASIASADDTTTLTNSGAPSAASDVQVGTDAPANQTMTLTLQLSMPSTAQAEQLLASGTVLTPAQYASRFGISPERMAKVSAWATSHGLTVTSTSSASGQVTVTGPVSAINDAFSVKEKHGKLHGTAGLTITQAPQVPSSLGLSGIAGLNTLSHAIPATKSQPDSGRLTFMRPPHGGKKPKSDGSTDCSQYWGDHLYPSAKKYANESNYMCGYSPADLQTMYGATPVAGEKPTLGILLWGGDNDIQATTNTYMSAAGYPQLKNFQATIETANANMKDCGPNDIQGEQAMDVQATHAIAPSAAIRYYGAASCYDADLTTELQKMVDAHQVSTISMSFGEPYDDGMTQADQDAWNRPLLQAALTGISTFTSSGDDGNNSTSNDLGADGAADGNPHEGFPASSAYVTAVGGTSVGMRANGSQPVVSGWEDAFYTQPDPTQKTFTPLANAPVFGAGGGFSAVVSQPSWQKGIVSGSTTKRAVPDIAALGDPYTGFSAYYRNYTTDDSGAVTGSSVDYTTLGGTSLSSPIVAAMTGLAKAHNHSSIGLITPLLYAHHGNMLTDVNNPDNAGVYFPSQKRGNLIIALDGKPQNLVTNRGWDNVTGLGTPYGMNFFNAIK